MKTNSMQTGPMGGSSRDIRFEEREKALANEQLSDSGRGVLRRAELPGKGWVERRLDVTEKVRLGEQVWV